MRTIGEIMHHLITVEKSSLLSDATKEMVKFNRGSIIVTDHKKPVGILTERDILRIVSKGLNLSHTKVDEVYTKKIISADEKTSIDEAWKMIEDAKIRRLPVTKNGEIVGMVTLTTLAKNKRFSIAENLFRESFNHGISEEEASRYK